VLNHLMIAQYVKRLFVLRIVHQKLATVQTVAMLIQNQIAAVGKIHLGITYAVCHVANT
jgi:hypothetical protein